MIICYNLIKYFAERHQRPMDAYSKAAQIRQRGGGRQKRYG